MFDQGRVFEPSVPITRPPKGHTSYLVVCEQMLEVTTHWTGVSLMCPGGPDCPACMQSYPTRSVFYLAAKRAGGERTLLELPHCCANKLDMWKEAGQLHAGVISVNRGTRPLDIQIELQRPREHRSLQVVSPDEIKDSLARIFHLPRRKEFRDLGAWHVAMKEKAADRLRVALQAAGCLSSGTTV